MVNSPRKLAEKEVMEIVLFSQSGHDTGPANQKLAPVLLNLTAFTPCLTGLVDYPFTSRHEGPGFNPHGGAYVKPGLYNNIVLYSYIQ